MREYLKNLSFHYQGYAPDIYQALMRKESVPDYPCRYPYICIGDKSYPQSLYALRYPPCVLYYRGDISLLQKPKMTITGSRRPSHYACEMTKRLSRHVSQKCVVLSGFAKGIDTIAHQSALKGDTIAVFASSLDWIYPLENKLLHDIMAQEHLIISEIPEGVSLKPHHFLMRNRLLAALGEACYVMSAWEKSACLNIVSSALEMNKDIYCLPHLLTDRSGEGCNRLIADGAMILTNEDLLFKI